uniref:non-specific serine/threonine protein kinase n=2 Tax=Cyprinus carpio TaxID=7962 RepID=A0A8C0YGZ3_CYPCA
MGQKRKRSSSENVNDYDLMYEQSAPPISSSTNVAVNHLQPADPGEGNERQVRKRRKISSFAESPSRLSSDPRASSGHNVTFEDQGTAPEWQRSTEDQGSLQHKTSPVENHGLQEPRTHGPDVISTEDQQVQPPPAQDLNCDILSRYEIGKKLGEGSYGAVFEGIRLKDGLKVALKFALKTDAMEYINIPGHPTPLPLEVALTMLANKGPSIPQIVQLLEWQDQLGFYIMVLERPSPCEDLFDFLEHHGGVLSEDLARLVMWQVVQAAHTCCRRGVLHRDIKLENLLINKDTLEVKLIDFGCGDLLKTSAYETFWGTELYCPPEFEKRGKYHGKPATVWSLGVLLFELVCGDPPESKDLDIIEAGIWSKPGLSKDCCHLIQSCLQRKPNHRLGLRKIILQDWFKVTK